MKEGKVSRTAEDCAAMRAIESSKPGHQRVCYDPLAVEFLGPRSGVIRRSPFLARAALWFLSERRFPGVAGEVVVRTRYIDDYLEECIANGIRQLAILGAGYDSRAYRIEGLKGKMKVFEVDHPSTQKAKTEKLKKILGSLPDSVVYVPIDFHKEKLDQRLFESGYDRTLKTLFIWEGVTSYITAEAVDETLAFVVNNSGVGSSVIFSYVSRSVVDGTCELATARRFQEYLTKIGEPFVFGIEEGTIERFLANRGFCQVSNASPTFLQSTYFKGENQGRKVAPYLAIVHATVKPQG